METIETVEAMETIEGIDTIETIEAMETIETGESTNYLATCWPQRQKALHHARAREVHSPWPWTTSS
jgi:hypothetical protein